MIPESHPLRQLFEELVSEHYVSDMHLFDPQISSYVANILTEFCETDQLYKIRDASGRPPHDVGEMLVESNPMLDARSFERERQVRKHIGDYTLFLTGMFPEYVATLPRRGLRLDSLVDYVKAGKESYRIVAAFDQFEYRQVAPLFRRLAEEFEWCVYGLNRVKSDLEGMREEQYRAWKNGLLRG